MIRETDFIPWTCLPVKLGVGQMSVSAQRWVAGLCSAEERMSGWL